MQTEPENNYGAPRMPPEPYSGAAIRKANERTAIFDPPNTVSDSGKTASPSFFESDGADARKRLRLRPGPAALNDEKHAGPEIFRIFVRINRL